ATVAVPEVGGIKSRPDAVTVTPNGLTAYVVDGANKRVYPLTISSGTLGAAITVNTQGDPGAILVTPNGEKLYVANCCRRECPSHADRHGADRLRNWLCPDAPYLGRGQPASAGLGAARARHPVHGIRAQSARGRRDRGIHGRLAHLKQAGGRDV